MASSRRNRRRDERRAQAVRSHEVQRARKGDIEPGFFGRLSGDWVVGGLIAGVVVIAIIVFLAAQIVRDGSTDPGFLQVSGVAVDPTNASVILLADSNGLFRSTDGGNHWDDVAFGGQEVHSVIADSTQDDVFFAAGDDVLARSDDSGLTWRDLTADLPSRNIRSLAINPTDGSDLYAFVDGTGLYRSGDAGVTWRAVNSESEAKISSLAVTAGNPENVFAFHTVRGLLVSRDGGASFDTVRGGIPFRAVADIQADSADPNALYAIALGKFYRSDDLGESWELSNEGLDDHHAVATWSASDGLYVTDRFGEIFVSRNGGSNWSQYVDFN